MAQTAQWVIGLTGGIGSGKSAAARMFAELGAAVVDTDAISHELTAAGGSALPALQAAFGRAFLAADGSLNRPAMRRLAYADAQAKARLENILHPAIRRLSAERCQQAFATGAPYVVLVVPLLVESGDFRRRCHRVVVVDCTEEAQIQRVIARSGLTAEEVRAIMAAQARRAARLAAADDVLDNNGDLAALRLQVSALHQRWLTDAALRAGC